MKSTNFTDSSRLNNQITSGLTLGHRKQNPINIEQEGKLLASESNLRQAPGNNRKLTRAFRPISLLIRPHRWTLIGSGVLLVLSQIARIAIPYSSKYLIDTVVLAHAPGKLTWLTVAVLSAAVIDSATFFSASQLLSMVAEDLIKNLRRQIQRHVLSLPITYFNTNLVGTIVSRIMSDVEGIRSLVGTGLVQFLIAILSSTITFIVLVHKSWELTLPICGVQLLVAYSFRRIFTINRVVVRESNKLRADVTGRLSESIAGIRVIKSYSAEAREAEVFSQGVHRIFLNAMESRIGSSSMGITAIMSFGLSTALIMNFGGRYLFRGTWTTGDYIQYMALLSYLISPTFQLVNIGTQLIEAVAGLDKINEVISEASEDHDGSRSGRLPSISGNVVFTNVSFSYVPNTLVLHGISFESPAGTITALVGPSGSGKSTIISLLSAFHNPDSGQILIDGFDLSTLKLDGYRSQLGAVFQECFLFEGTIRDNILFGNPDISEEKFLEACQCAHVQEFVERFPSGYQTVVGERGVMLSGGQRQRVSIARAIVADPRILILDEATSSLDSESEALIQESLSYLMKGRTTFVIAHRLSTIRSADQILLIERGRIVERGTHQSLYQVGTRYHALYLQQNGLQIVTR